MFRCRFVRGGILPNPYPVPFRHQHLRSSRIRSQLCKIASRGYVQSCQLMYGRHVRWRFLFRWPLEKSEAGKMGIPVLRMDIAVISGFTCSRSALNCGVFWLDHEDFLCSLGRSSYEKHTCYKEKTDEETWTQHLLHAFCIQTWWIVAYHKNQEKHFCVLRFNCIQFFVNFRQIVRQFSKWMYLIKLMRLLFNAKRTKCIGKAVKN